MRRALLMAVVVALTTSGFVAVAPAAHAVVSNLSIADASIAEGDSGTSDLSFTISVDAAAPSDITGTVSTSDGSAQSGGTAASGGADYVPLTSVPFTIAADATSTTVTVEINGDTTYEPDESFTATVADVVNAAVDDGTATGSITNDDSQPSATIGPVSASEGTGAGGTLSFPLTLSNASYQDVGITLSTSDGSAHAPGDYTARTDAIVTINAGSTTGTFDVSIVGDALNEANETMGATITAVSNGTIGGASAAVGTINDDDGQPSLSINDATVTEGNSGTVTATFTVTLSVASGQTVTVHAATANGTATAPSDYTAITDQLLTFTPSTVTQTVSVTVNGDQHGEPNETYSVKLTNATNATIADGTGLGTITNDDACGGGATANAHYVCNLYLDLLGRQADPGGLAYFSGRLDGGMNRTDLVAALISSREYRVEFVQRSYQQLLGRPADSGGLSYHVDVVLTQPGARLDSVLTSIMGSGEYKATRGGGTAAGFVNAAYHDLLGRAPDAGGAAYFTQQAQSTSDGNVALTLERSDERYRLMLATTGTLVGYGTQGFYPAYLRRAPDPGGEANIRSYLDAGGLPEVAIYVLLSSNEYYVLP